MRAGQHGYRPDPINANSRSKPARYARSYNALNATVLVAKEITMPKSTRPETSKKSRQKDPTNRLKLSPPHSRFPAPPRFFSNENRRLGACSRSPGGFPAPHAEKARFMREGRVASVLLRVRCASDSRATAPRSTVKDLHNCGASDPDGRGKAPDSVLMADAGWCT